MKAPSKDWAGGKCSVVLPLLKQALLSALKKYDCRVVNIWEGSKVTTLALVSSFVQKSLTSYSHLAFKCKRIGSLPILLKDIVANVCALQLLKLRIERFWRNCCKEDVLAAHHRVLQMNFILGGYAIPAIL